MSLTFRVEGDLDRVLVPTSDRPGRRDGLWKHCCFEAFIAMAKGEPYLEINLSPSGDWAAYLFSGYRRDMKDAAIPAPAVVGRAGQGGLSLSADLDLAGLGDIDPEQRLEIGLCAVIEAKDESLSYWALAHPSGPPDFHHRDCFVVQLPPAGQE